jgi:hypothetical protein
MLNDIYKIDIKILKDLIPQQLINKLDILGVKTIKDIKNTSVEDLKKIKSVGNKTIQDFLNIKKMIDEEPYKIFEEYSLKLNPIIQIPKNIGNIHLKYIKALITKRLLNKLELLNCETITDIIDISNNEFSNMDYIGKKTVLDFVNLKELIINNQKVIQDTYNKNRELILPYTYQNDFLLDVEYLISDYFNLINNKKVKDIIYKRFLLGNNELYTLEEIGLFYNITRERVRQIQNKHLNRIRILFEGGSIKNPYCISNEDMSKKYIQIKNKINTHNILVESELKNILNNENIVFDFRNQKQIIFLTIALMGGVKYTFDESIYFIINNSINHNFFELACNKVVSILQREVIPISFFDLAIKIRKVNKKVDNEILATVIKTLTYIEKVIDMNSEKYQIEFYKLNSLKNYADRILYEKQEIMHFSEIWREIQHRLEIKHINIQELKKSLNNQLVSDPRFTPIGGSGNWSLAEWNNDSSSIIELVLKSIFYYNKPISTNEIAQYVSEIRPHVKQQSIYSIISQQKDKILKTSNGKFILREWASHYHDAYETGKISNIVSMDEFCDILFEIYKKNPKVKYSVKEFQEELKKYDIFWTESYYYAKFVSCPALIKEKGNKKIYFSINNNYRHSISKSIPKLEVLKVKIIKLLDETDSGTLKLNYIVNTLKKDGEIKSNIYSTISNNPNTFIKKTVNKKKIIQLSERKIENKIKNDIKKHIENIKNGENKIIEFKSTLRWDLKKNIVNKEIEFMVIKAIAAFLNTDGGILYIGIEENSDAIGLKNDYKTFKKKNRDGFLLHLNDLLTNYFTKIIFAFIEPNIENISGNDIAIIEVKKANNPIYILKDNIKMFFIRGTASVQKLDVEEAAGYIKAHWM